MVSTQNGVMVSDRASRVVIAYIICLSDFRERSFKKLEHLGDTAVDAQRYDEAISHYSTVLSRKPTNIVNILVKRSRARSLMGLWVEALDDADEVRFVVRIRIRLSLSTLYTN